MNKERENIRLLKNEMEWLKIYDILRGHEERIECYWWADRNFDD